MLLKQSSHDHDANYAIIICSLYFLMVKMWQIRWEYVMEYSKDISSLLGHPKSSPDPVIEDPKEVLKVNL